jgi:hypothetical protein
MFVTWTSFTCEVGGSRFRKHRCERCRTVYGYEMHRTVRENSSSLYGLGQEAARERAEMNAKRALENELTNGFDLVPCPNCGWYQSRMVSVVRDEKCRWLSTTWALCLALCVVCVFAAIGIPNETRSKGEIPDEFEEMTVLVSLVGAGISLSLCGVFFFVDNSRRRKLDLNGSPVAERLAKARECGAVIVEASTENGTPRA